jgi:ADP-dependent phosphofructokinase/glucokinase
VDTRYFSFPAPTIWPESPYQRYQRALHFARTFNLEWLYVHSEDLNLVVRRDASKDELSDQRDALLLAKLAVPKAIVVRSLPAEEVPKWEAKVVPTLAEKGFISLILFAYEYAQAEAANEDQFEKIFRSLVLKGYHCRQPGEEEPYSVIAVPVVWPEMPDNINTVGAGDMSSALVRALTP